MAEKPEPGPADRVRLDENTIVPPLAFERLLSELFASFVNIPSGEFDQKIDQALMRIGEVLKTDRCHLLQYRDDIRQYTVTHSWAARGVPKAQALGIGTEDVPWIAENFALPLKIFQAASLCDLPEEAEAERELALAFGTKSISIVPIIENGFPMGAFVLEQVLSERAWSPECVRPLERLAEVLLNVLAKKRSEEKLARAFSEIRELKERLESERNYLIEEIRTEHDFANIIGASQPIRRVLRLVEQVAPTDSTVLVLGETGTGKELIARAIHDKSRRRERPLIKVNCASLSPQVVESELFGHEKGAFTGALASRKGRFELAHGATLFLDEIGELALETQAKLLRVLQEGEFEKVGSSVTRKVDVRLIAATNRNLAREVQEGRFRKDLWFRLNVFPLTVPPLRERRGDLPLLVRFLAARLAKKTGIPVDRISPEAMAGLEAYDWPGNVRELENLLERAVICSSGGVLRLAAQPEAGPARAADSVRPRSLRDVERDYIIEILNETSWQVGGKQGAAAILDLPVSTLRARMKKLGIQKP